MPPSRIVYTLGLQRISQTTFDAAQPNGGALFFGHDSRGSTRILTDLSGNIATVNAVRQVFFYEAYGRLLNMAATDAATAFLNTGEQFDANTGFQYNRERYTPGFYFLGLDPFTGDPWNPITFNKHLFGNADGANNIDPTGWESLGGLSVSMSMSVSLNGLGAAGVYVAQQAAISTIQTVVEYSVLSLIFPDAKFDAFRTFGTNFAVNVVTGGIGNFWLRNLADIAVNSASDVVWGGEEPLESIVTNIVGAFGSEALENVMGSIIRRAIRSVGGGIDLPVIGPPVNPIPPTQPPFNPFGTVGAAMPWTMKARLKHAQLPTTGKIRYVPPKGHPPSQPLPRGLNNGYKDRFGNEWTKGPSRTLGEPFEWDVQLGLNASPGVTWASPDGKHLNVSLNGEVTH